jgi:hypothetical protein
LKKKNKYFLFGNNNSVFVMTINKIMHSDANPNNVQFFTSEDAPEVHIKQSHIITKVIKRLELKHKNPNYETEREYKLAVRDEYEPTISSAKNYGATNKEKMQSDSQHNRLMKVYANKVEFIKQYDSVLEYFNSFNTIDLSQFNKKYFLFSEQ